MNLNKIILIGRISQQISESVTKSGIKYVRFNLAVSRDTYGQDRTEVTDFIPVVAFNNNANFISKYFNKGDLVNIVGSLQMSQYTTKNGDVVNSSTVVVEQIKSLEPINVTQARAEKNQNTSENNYSNASFYQENKQMENHNEDKSSDDNDNPWELDL